MAIIKLFLLFPVLGYWRKNSTILSHPTRRDFISQNSSSQNSSSAMKGVKKRYHVMDVLYWRVTLTLI